MMRQNRILRLLGIIILTAVLFFLIQALGGYLIAEITSFNTPFAGDDVTVEVVEKTILRLEAMDYYTCHVGSFSEIALAQAEIDQFAQAGYRVYAVGTNPYHIYLGCWSQEPDLASMPAEFQELGKDVYLAKNTLNSVSLKFADSEPIYSDRIAPLIASVDVLLKHSLKMFVEPNYAQYTEENWQEMLEALDEECEQLDAEVAAIILNEDETISQALLDLQSALADYRQGLQVIAKAQNDKAVYLAQSYLLQLIDRYHTTILDLSI